MKKTNKRRHRGPSEGSLKEIPEIDFTKTRTRRNPYAARIAEQGAVVQVGRGRPRKVMEVGGTSPRSVRFPDAVWEKLEKRAKAEGVTVHAVMREAILAWLEHAA